MANRTVYERLPLHELLAAGKGQGLWPIPMAVEHLPTERILALEHARTGHKIAYIRAVYEAGRRLDPSNMPSLIAVKPGERVKVDVPSTGHGKFKSRPNPVKRAAIERAGKARQSVINAANRVVVLKPKPGILVGVKAHTLYTDDTVPNSSRSAVLPSHLRNIQTNGPQIARTAEQFAPVVTNSRMRKASKNTTAFSTGFVPPSRTDNTRAIPKKQEGTHKRFSKT